MEHESSFAPGTSQKIGSKILETVSKKCKLITPKLKPGDVLVHHCLMVHGSNENKSEKNRRGFTIQFKDKNSSYDNELLENYEKKLNQQMKLRNQI